jgi:hypothetical protein
MCAVLLEPPFGPRRVVAPPGDVERAGQYPHRHRVIVEDELRTVVNRSGAVYVADRNGVTYANMSEQ